MVENLVIFTWIIYLYSPPNIFKTLKRETGTIVLNGAMSKLLTNVRIVLKFCTVIEYTCGHHASVCTALK